MEYGSDVHIAPENVLFLPEDSVVQKVQERLGVELSRMKKLKAWTQFISFVTFSDPELFSGVSGEYQNAYGKIEVDFKKMKLMVSPNVTLNISKVTELRGFKIVSIKGILISQALIDLFVSEFWSSLPADVFFMLASNVNPRDVLRLCSTSKSLQSKCDAKFYSKMLQVHYGRKSEQPKATFIRLANAKVWSCGRGAEAQLGHGDKADQLIPKRIESLSDLIAISGGSEHSLFLDRNGKVWSCGYGGYSGRHDQGEMTDRWIPKQIESLSDVIVIAISAGVIHSLFLDRNGKVWSCGYGEYGRLGHGNDTEQLIPKHIEGLSDVIAIGAGVNHSLFLDRNGKVWSCGNGDYGRLGHGDTTDRWIPKQIESLSDVIAISAEDIHSLFLDRHGKVWSCGLGGEGQLGHGDTTNQLIPKKIESLSDVISISGGYGHSLFLDRNGKVWSCGSGLYGQIGHGNHINQWIPKQIEGLFDVITISGGGYHSLFLDRKGKVWSFGSGNYGQLGHGDQSRQSIPKQIESLSDVTVISAGSCHSLFIA
jgi:alpha-tubulin suppressor-like RCC1 family protein